MRFSFALLGLLLAGCPNNTPVDPCAGESGACISARVEGNAKSLDQLRFSVTMPSPAEVITPGTRSPFSLPVRVGIVLPAGAPTSLDITLEGLSNGSATARDVVTATLTNNRASVTFTLNEGSELPDMVALPDLTMLPDLQSPPPIVISVSPSPSPAVVRELERINLTFSASDPLMQMVTMAIQMSPLGATATPSGGMVDFNWVPDHTQAGSYTIVGAATAMDTTRNRQLPWNIRVENVVDEVFKLNPNDMLMIGAPHAHSIGDFDNDGRADLASCSVSGTAVYSVNILYGDVTGLPNMTPLPAARLKAYTFNGDTGTSANERLPCTGADMDSDGFSDVIISDPNANSGLGMIYIFWGTMRANDTSTAMQAMAPTSLVAGEKLGSNPVFVGKYTAGRGDFATMTYPTPGGASVDNVNIFLGKAMRPVTATFVTTPDRKSLATAPCGLRSIIGFGDIDAAVDNLDELLVFDKQVGSINCPTTVVGGFEAFKSSGASTKYRRPATTTPNYGKDGSTLCDVNGDGHADFVVPDSLVDGKALIYPGPFPLVNTDELDITMTMQVAASPAGHLYSDARCVKNFFFNAPWTLLLVDPGDVTNSSRVDLVQGFDAGLGTGVVRGTLLNPIPADKKFGTIYAGSGDFNGDGKNDVIAGAPGGRYWSVFGR